MKSYILLALISSLVVLVTAETYTDRYDNTNIDEILENKKLLSAYIKCLLEEGKCTPEGKALKAHIKDAMQKGCESCTPKQKEAARKVVKHMKSKEPENWEKLKKFYDPNDEYEPIYEDFLARDD